MSDGRIMLNKRISDSSIKKMMKFFLLILILMISISLLSQSAWAGTAIARLGWDANTELDLAGYRIYVGTSPRTGTDPKVCGMCGYSKVIDVRNSTTGIAGGLIHNKNYYMSVTAYDYSYNESAFSTEVSGKAKEVYINFDGDGKTDIAIYRSSNGGWYIIPSSNPGVPYSVSWGASGDVIVPGDYDGDGKMDIAVYRPSNCIWYIVPSSGVTPYAVGWGGNGYIPVN